MTNSFTYSGRAQDLAGNSSGSETRTLQGDGLPPTVPTLVAPISGAYLNNTTPALQWTTAIDTGIGMSGYVRQISTVNNFASILLSGNTITTGITSSALANGTFYRRVKSYDKAMNSGNRSTVWSFMVDTNTPTIVFTGTTPLHNASMTGNDLAIQMQITET